MIPRTFPSIVEAFQTKMVVYVVPSITGLKAWIDYIPVKGVVTESATLANTYANGGYQVVKSLDSLTGLQAWIGYIPVYEDAAYNKPWSTDAGGYIPVGGLFSIPSLFSSGAPGVWYDPSDYSTLFQDSAGTTPVTAVEQPVGLMLDKSQGLVLGPELVTNGDFSNGTTGWAATNATLTNVAGQLRVAKDSAAAFCITRTEITGLTVGRTYRILGTFSAISLANNTQVWVGTAGGAQDLNLNRNSTTVGSISAAFVAGATTRQVEFVMNGSAGVVSVMEIDNISVKELAGNHAFQSTSASRPVLKIDGNGKLFLKFDGVDDSLSTNSISFTATDKMSVFAGVRKLSDAAIGIIAELSANSGSGNNGAFGLRAPYNSATADYGFLSNGTAAVGAVATSFIAPITNVVTGLGNISGPSATLRVNASQVANVTSSQGTGNYGNYPLYIGRRNNASLPFNGQLYSMIIVGKAVTAGELSSTETYVNQKTGAY